MSCSSVMAYYGYPSPPARGTYPSPAPSHVVNIPTAPESHKKKSPSLSHVVRKILHPRRDSAARPDLSRSSSSSSDNDTLADTEIESKAPHAPCAE
ncbi:unnamed protein product [Mycena citricolor]|uniref:Uncharacterized protein n=1 Tax=Mycena citricolor TaxID=2018698 RepID=A0AAD2HE44_9AGAR|nr:unnamed protein product [Mycena citricolor]CAK5283021.1 unnamed protein product [Mycena citricolor]